MNIYGEMRADDWARRQEAAWIRKVQSRKRIRAQVSSLTYFSRLLSESARRTAGVLNQLGREIARISK